MLVLLLISGIVTEYIKAISKPTEIAVGLENIYCLEQYVISVINFKNCFGIHKSDIKTNDDRCGTAKDFNG